MGFDAQWNIQLPRLRSEVTKSRSDLNTAYLSTFINSKFSKLLPIPGIRDSALKLVES